MIQNALKEMEARLKLLYQGRNSMFNITLLLAILVHRTFRHFPNDTVSSLSIIIPLNDSIKTAWKKAIFTRFQILIRKGVVQNTKAVSLH